MKQSQFYYLLRRGLFSAGSAIIKNGLVMFNKFTTAGLSFPVQGSAAFNGTSDFIDVATLPLSDFTNFTYSGWAYFNTASYQNIFGFGNTTNSTPVSLIEIQSGARINFFHRDASSQSVGVLSPAVNLNQWYFITATKEGTSHKLYIDGSISNTGSGSVPNPTFNTCSIGALNRVSLTNYFNGNLANVAIWNRALSSDEINSVMWKPVQALTATESNGLQAWYSLDDIASPTASLASMEQLATDKDVTIENKAAITAAINKLS